MKKTTFITLAAIAAAFSFSSCQKNEVPSPREEKGGNFTIFADITKTSIEGLQTKWADGDAINVFHIANDDWASKNWDAFTSDGQFTLSDVESGAFSGTVSQKLSGAYRWYALYKYNSNLSTPDNTTCFFNIGCKNSYSTPQVQAGNNSTAHLCGEYFPLYAQSAQAWESGDVSLQFKPALSIVKFHVVNKTSKPVTVTGLSIEAEEEIIGSFFINFAETLPTFTVSDSRYVSKKATLSVSGATALAQNESADFYIAIKPFSNAAGKTLKFTVNGYEKTTTAAYDFEGGKVKTVTFNFDREEKDYSGKYVAMVLQSSKYYALSSEANGERLWARVLSDYEGGESYTTTDAKLVWNVSKEDGGYVFENGGKYLYWTSDNYASVSTKKLYLTLEENASTGTFSVSAVSDPRRKLAKNTSNDYFAFYGGTQEKDILLVPGTLDTTPVIEPIENPSSVSADATTGFSVPYSVLNPVDGRTATASSSENWISNIDCSTFGTIVFDIAANPNPTERSSTITVSYAGAKESRTFTLTQEGKSTGDKKTYTLTILPEDFTSKSYADNDKKHDKDAVAGDGTTLTVTYTSYQVMLSNSLIQFRKNDGYIYNQTALGTIKSVTVNSTAGTFTTYYGTSPQPKSGTTVGNGYFNICVGGATGKAKSIVIVFEK